MLNPDDSKDDNSSTDSRVMSEDDDEFLDAYEYSFHDSTTQKIQLADVSFDDPTIKAIRMKQLKKFKNYEMNLSKKTGVQEERAKADECLDQSSSDAIENKLQFFENMLELRKKNFNSMSKFRKTRFVGPDFLVNSVRDQFVDCLSKQSSDLALVNLNQVDECDRNSEKFKTWPAWKANLRTKSESSESNLTNSCKHDQFISSDNIDSNFSTTNDESIKNDNSNENESPANHDNINNKLDDEEFISPVDKQIAAIFQISASHLNNHSHLPFRRHSYSRSKKKMSSNTSLDKNSSNPNSTLASNAIAGNDSNLKHDIETPSVDEEEDEDLDNEDDQQDESSSMLADENECDCDETDLNSSKAKQRSVRYANERDELHSEKISKSAKQLVNRKNSFLNDPNSGAKLKKSISFTQKSKSQKLRQAFNKFRNTMKSVQSRTEEVFNNSNDCSGSDSDGVIVNESDKAVKYKSARRNKNSFDFSKTQIIQKLNIKVASTESSHLHSKAIIWSIKFSPCGKLLATAGKDQILRVWVLKSAYEHFCDMRKRYLTNPNEKDNFQQRDETKMDGSLTSENSQTGPFKPTPLAIFHGHVSDILDVSWSKNLFIVSASSDKTCRLWSIYKVTCLCTFYHTSIVSSISFHPKDDRYFVSGCLDGKLRVWNVVDKKVVLWNDISSINKSLTKFITAISFCQSGKTVAVGTFDGKCILYQTEHLKYYSLINVRSTRGRNSKGSKITGIEVLNNDENKLLITSNDSRVRLYDLRDLSLICKYKGFMNSTVHIKASISPDDKFIVCGSENKCMYVWKTNYPIPMLTSDRRDRNMYWERMQAHNSIVTCAVFSPNPEQVMQSFIKSPSTSSPSSSSDTKGSKSKTLDFSNIHVLASAAGCDGTIKIFANKIVETRT